MILMKKKSLKKE